MLIEFCICSVGATRCCNNLENVLLSDIFDRVAVALAAALAERLAEQLERGIQGRGTSMGTGTFLYTRMYIYIYICIYTYICKTVMGLCKR